MFRVETRAVGGWWVVKSRHRRKEAAMKRWRELVATIVEGGVQVIGPDGDYVIRVVTPGTMRKEPPTPTPAAPEGTGKP